MATIFIQCKSEKQDTILSQIAIEVQEASNVQTDTVIDFTLNNAIPDTANGFENITPTMGKTGKPKDPTINVVPPTHNMKASKIKKKAKIQFVDTFFDADTIKEGDRVKHNYIFTNTGNADLVVTETSATCGCTVPSIPNFPLEPGEGSAISVTFNSQGKSGEQLAEMTVHSNGSKKPIVLKMKIVVE